MAPASEVIICTRNRSENLTRCLDSILNQDVLPAILVVDSSDDDKTRIVVESFRRKLRSRGQTVRYVRCAPGLTHQRNAGLARLSPEVGLVHFIDDDVYLHPGYFREIEKVFDRDTTAAIGGVGGVIMNAPSRNPSLIRRLFLLDSPRGGRVLPSGRNILADPINGVFQVDWLSGCAMSFRRKVFEASRFDERLEGYALMEDLNFCFLVRRTWALMVSGAAQMDHYWSPAGREDRWALTRLEVLRRHAFVRENRDQGLRPAAFWWSILGEVAILITKAATRARRDPLRRVSAISRAAVEVIAAFRLFGCRGEKSGT